MSENHSIEAAVRNGYSFRISEYFSSAIRYFQESSGGFLGFGAVFVMSAFILDYVLEPLPSIYKFIISDFLMTILGLGSSIYTFKMFREEKYTFTHFFDGFLNIIPLATVYLLHGAVFLIFFVVLAQILPVEEIMSLAGEGYSPENIQEMASLLEDSMFEFFIISVILLYITVSLRWSYMLVLFHQYSPWNAIVTSIKLINKRFWAHFGIMFLFGLMYTLGALFFYIGLAVAVPIIGITNFISYADVTGLKKPGQVAEKDMNPFSLD